MFVKLVRPWFFGGVLYEAGVREIPGVKGYAESFKKKPEEVIPKGATLVEGGVTDLPKTHPTVSTLSEMAKTPATDAVTASKGPTVIVSDAAMAGKSEEDSKVKPVETKK